MRKYYQRVANWTRSDNNVRVRLAIGRLRDGPTRSNPDQHRSSRERRTCYFLSASRMLGTRICESSIDLELRVWVNDPQNGIANVSSEIYLEVWRRFKKARIQMPFPQRDLHIKSEPGRLLDTA